MKNTNKDGKAFGCDIAVGRDEHRTWLVDKKGIPSLLSPSPTRFARYIPKEYGNKWQVFDTLTQKPFDGGGCDRKECERNCWHLNNYESEQLKRNARND